jgi:hypothetical protein
MGNLVAVEAMVKFATALRKPPRHSAAFRGIVAETGVEPAAV